MAKAKKKTKNTLPSGSKRLQVYVGMVDVLDENGNPVLDENGKVKKKRKYESITAPTMEEAKALKAQVQEAYKVNPNEMTVRDGIDAYIASIRAVESPKTIEGYEIIRDNAFSSLMSLNIKRPDNALLQKAINEECKRPSRSTRSKGKPISAKTVRNEWGLLKKNNLLHMSFHDLRHVNASVMSFLSIPTEYAMDRGGWSSPKVMQGTYMQVYDSERIKVDNTIDEYFENELFQSKIIDEKYNAWLTLFDKTDCVESRKEYENFTNATQNATRTKENP